MSGSIKRPKPGGNIFDDLGFDQPEEWKTKAHLAAHILRTVEKSGLTQAAAAKKLGVAQPEVSNLKRGQLDRFSIDRLLRFLVALDQRVEISIRPQAASAARESISVYTP